MLHVNSAMPTRFAVLLLSFVSSTRMRYALYDLEFCRKTVAVANCCVNRLRSSTEASTSPVSSLVMPRTSNFLGYPCM